MVDITVPVPEERTAEFYQFFGLWLAKSLSLTPEVSQSNLGDSAASPTAAAKRKHWTGDEDLDDAVLMWKKFSKHARGLFSLLADNPGTKYTGTEIAEAVGIPNGSRGVAGALAWPGRHAAAINRHLPSHWEEDEDAGVSHYWMSPEVASVFKTARDKVEGKTGQ